MWLRSGQMKMGAAILADSNLAVSLQTASETSTRRCLQVGTMSVVELRLTLQSGRLLAKATLHRQAALGRRCLIDHEVSVDHFHFV